MDKVLVTYGKFFLIVVLAAIIGIFFAFPIKWCWNYSVVYIWNLPAITWGQAWCLNFLSGMLIQSSFNHYINQ